MERVYRVELVRLLYYLHTVWNAEEALHLVNRRSIQLCGLDSSRRVRHFKQLFQKQRSLQRNPLTSKSF